MSLRLPTALLEANGLVELPLVKLPSKVNSFKEEQKCFDKARLDIKKGLPPRYTIPDASGTFSHAFYHRLDFLEAEEKELNFVYLTLNSIKGKREEILPQLINAQNLILKKGVPDDFHEYYVYVNSKGDRLAFKKTPLHAYVQTYKYTHILPPEEIKNLITDAVLAVYDFHKRNLVHRDIKSENCLLTYRDGKLSLKYADHDSTVLVDDEGHYEGDLYTFGTPECMSPILIQHYKKFSAKDSPFIPAIDAKQLNLKEMDLYALGKLICDELSLLATEEDRAAILKAFDYLCDAKAAESSCHSGTIKRVVNNPYFGTTFEEKRKHFKDRRAYVRTLKQKINGEYATRRPMDDPLLVLAPPAQTVYAAGKSLAEAMQEQPRTLPQIAVLVDKMETLNRACSMIKSDKFLLFANNVQKAAHEDFEKNFPSINFLQLAISNALNEFKTLHPTQLIKQRFLWRACATVVREAPELIRANQLMKSIACLQSNPVAAMQEVYAYFKQDLDTPMAQSFRATLIKSLSRLPENTLAELKLNLREIASIGTVGMDGIRTIRVVEPTCSGLR